MAGEWRTQTFADLVGGKDNIIGGPFGSNLTQADYSPQGVPVIRGSNMEKAGRYISGDFAYVSLEKADRLQSNQVEPGDIIVTQRGTMGQVSLVPIGRSTRYVVSQSQMGVRVRNSDPLFIYYLLRSPQFLNFLAGATIQTGVPHINMGLLRTWEVGAPDVREQRLIAKLLGSLDEKIELNRRTSETLEAMARALFKSWFVDFDPVYANAERRSTSLHDDLATLFPDSFGEDGLPSGWTAKPVSKLANFLNGLALQKYPAEDDEPSLPVIKIAELRTGPTPKSAKASINIPAEYRIENGDHLFSWSGSLTHCRWTYGMGALNQHLFKVTPCEPYPVWLVYEAVDQHMPEFRAIASGKAVTMGHIQRHHLDEARVAIPPSDLLKAMDAVVAPIFVRWLAADLESRTLADLRDTLLPKLISGDLRITDVENRVAAA